MKPFTPPSWETCFKAGMTSAQAAAIRGVSRNSARKWANRVGAVWPDADLVASQKAVTAIARVKADVMDGDPGGPYAEPDVDACRTMWAAVLLNEWRIATDPATSGKRAREKVAALAWFSGRWCGVICAFVGLDHDAVIGAVQRGIRPPESTRNGGRRPIRYLDRRQHASAGKPDMKGAA